MKYDKVTIIGVAVCVLLLLSWGRLLDALGFQRPGRTPPPATQNETPSETSAPQTSAPQTGAPAAAEGAASAATSALVPANPEDDARRQPWEPPRTPPVRLSSPDRENELVANVDPGGGGVTLVTLSQYARDVVTATHPREPVTLGRGEYPFLALNLRGAGIELGPASVVDSTPAALEIRRETAAGLVVSERWEVLPTAPYQMLYTVRFRNAGPAAVRLQGLAIEAGAMPPTESVRAAAVRSVQSTVTIASTDPQRPKSYTAKQVAKLVRKGQDRDLESRPAKWLAVQSQYFMLAVVAGKVDDDARFAGCQVDLRPVEAGTLSGRPVPQVWCQARALLPARTLDSGNESEFSFTGLATPKDYSLLQRVGGRLQTVVGMDSFMIWNPAWMGVLTRWLLDLLIWLHRLFGVSWGYGLAIIIITFAVKLLFWPLTHHSTTSMRKMQALQPQLKELREKYKSDPQKLYRKQSELFKENHVNQFSSCLPLLLQLPVFFALFVTFRGAIELRHASFLWSADLSMPDDVFSVFGVPLRPLAILMGLTMLLQQKLTPSAGDPQQQRMMSFMSIFFIFLFYSMPSGLTLYWTVSQLLSIVQMLWINRQSGKTDGNPATVQTPVAAKT
jgi:YidC/Oxa1 family membrane protein insertase